VLEPWFLSALVAVFVSGVCHFLSTWEARVRLRRLEMQVEELEERQMREVKQRAAKASVEARAGRLNPLDEALIRQHTGQLAPNYDSEGTPWWDGLVQKK